MLGVDIGFGPELNVETGGFMEDDDTALSSSSSSTTTTTTTTSTSTSIRNWSSSSLSSEGGAEEEGQEQGQEAQRGKGQREEAEEEAPEVWPEFDAAAAKEKKMSLEKRTKTARIAKVRAYKETHGLLKKGTALQFVNSNPGEAAIAVDLLTDVIMELFTLQDKVQDWLQTSEMLEVSGLPPLFDELANAVICDKVESGHCVWAELSTTFKNM